MLVVNSQVERIQLGPGGQSIEHVLPQNVAPDSVDWLEDWPDSSEREQWLHRIGNLALLNQKRNTKIGNKPFSTKRTLLRESPYPLTSAIGDVQHWHPADVEANHRTQDQRPQRRSVAALI